MTKTIEDLKKALETDDTQLLEECLNQLDLQSDDCNNILKSVEKTIKTAYDDFFSSIETTSMSEIYARIKLFQEKIMEENFQQNKLL